MAAPPLQCSAPISDLDFAPEVNGLVAGDVGGGVSLLDHLAGVTRREVKCDTAVLSVAYAAGRRALISAEGSMAKEISTVTVWDLDSCTKRVEMTYTNFLVTVAYSPELNVIITGDGNFMKDKRTGQVVVWNIDTLEQHRKLRCGGPVTSVAYEALRRVVFSADRANAVIKWDAESGNKCWEVTTELLPWRLVAAVDLGAIIVAESDFKALIGRITILDTESGERRFQLECGGPIACIAFVPELRAVVTGQRDGALTLWDLESRSQRWSRPMGFPVTAMAYCYVARRLAVGLKDGSVRILTLDELKG